MAIHRKEKLGLGSAYIAGFKKALHEGAEFVFEMDADLSHNPDDIPRFLEEVKKGSEVAVLFYGSISQEVIKAVEGLKVSPTLISIPMIQQLLLKPEKRAHCGDL